MEKRFLLRIYPTKEQEKLIQRTFGCARFVYNYFLDYRIKKYNEENISLTANDCSKVLTELKKRKRIFTNSRQICATKCIKRFGYGL